MNTGYVSVWILGDQLLERHPAVEQALAQVPAEKVCVLLVESRQRTRRLPYQQKKQVLLFSAMRHYAAWLREQGVVVDYRQAETFKTALTAHVQAYRPARLLTMAASEFRGRRFQIRRLPELLEIPVEVLPNTQFLAGRFDPYPGADAGKNVVQEYFYRAMRKHFGVLVEPDDRPVGGVWNYDRQNRAPLPDNLPLPDEMRFDPDEITQQVMEAVQRSGHGVGTVAGFDLAVTHSQARAALEDFVRRRLPNFGRYEDAMTQRSAGVFHSRLSPYLNLGLLEPLQVVRAAEGALTRQEAPINSVEGFVRQVLGWREYIYWQYWRLMPELAGENFWQANRQLPTFFWRGKTDMNCLNHVLRRAREAGYSHHIERLMLLTNFCQLAGFDPQAVNDWFLCFYVDAYEWVMLPNVLGMGLFADGGRTATKPYIASANYIHKMGDYCSSCVYDHRARTGETACPFNFLYWNFLLMHEDTLRANPRMGRNVLGLRYLDSLERERVRSQALAFLESLDAPYRSDSQPAR